MTMHLPTSKRVDGAKVLLPAHTFVEPNWSGWLTAVPPGGGVRSAPASFEIPKGFHPALNHASDLAFWVGTGGFGTPAILLRSGLAVYANQATVLLPSGGFLEDCSSNVACFSHLRTDRPATVQAGDVVTVRLHVLHWLGARSWFGFWMNTEILIEHQHHVIRLWRGRMYLPPWAVKQATVEAIVEAMGNPTGIVTALPRGQWQVPVWWQVQLYRAWPKAHSVHMVATGWYPRKGLVTHVTTTVLHFSTYGETGHGVVSYRDGGKS